MAKEKLTKTEAVRRAVAAGQEKPKDAVNWVKKEFSIDMTPAQFSVTKSNLKLTKKKKKSANSAAPTTAAATATPKKDRFEFPPSQNGSVSFDLLRSVKTLVSQHGGDKVKSIVDLFA